MSLSEAASHKTATWLMLAVPNIRIAYKSAFGIVQDRVGGTSSILQTA